MNDPALEIVELQNRLLSLEHEIEQLREEITKLKAKFEPFPYIPVYPDPQSGGTSYYPEEYGITWYAGSK